MCACVLDQRVGMLLGEVLRWKTLQLELIVLVRVGRRCSDGAKLQSVQWFSVEAVGLRLCGGLHGSNPALVRRI